MASLFLDRDGVINVRIPDGYVTRLEDFKLIDGVLEAMAIFARHFDHIFMVTNQQGIGKKLMSEADLDKIHQWFVEQVNSAGGKIDHIYYCPALKSANSFMRKPSIGMALQTRRDFPDIRLKESVMVGDTKSDMLFGHRAGMTTVLVGDEPEVATQNPHLVNYYYNTLIDYARSLDK
jgi:histidinol-phosphate phosphatase family protein